MAIKDDGKGFGLDQMKTSICNGLINLQSRVHAGGSEIDISSTTGEDTTILACVPRE